MSDEARFYQSIEPFAAVSAALDEPFGDRASLLGAAGLDAESWNRIIAHWSERMAQDDGDRLAVQFGDAYAAAKRAMRPRSSPSMSGAMLATGSLRAAPTSTMDIDVRVLVSSLPFTAAPLVVAPRLPVAPPRRELTGTLPLDPSEVGPVLPFKPTR